ncbi:MAG: glycosyltransferase family 1 protein [Acidobacteria bacterium]|nr:MAG: glycosyltransferase family 1 protein [Acidobacteriota bacterium]
MKILFISTFYPPFVIGGWEQLVEEVNGRLQTRGHVTHVLTSNYGMSEAKSHSDSFLTPGSKPSGIDRILTLEANLEHYSPLALFGYSRRLEKNLEATRDTIQRFQPDVVFIHIMWNLTRGIAWIAEQMCPGRVVYYVADHWPSAPDPHTDYWTQPATDNLRSAGKRVVAPLALRWIRRSNRDFRLEFQRVLCVSKSIREELFDRAVLDPANIHVVYNGIDTSRFSLAASGRVPPNGHLSLLFAGTLVWHKGVHTAIEAMRVLAARGETQGINLTIVGSGHPDYERQLRGLVKSYNLENLVEFRGRAQRDEIPSIFRRFDVLVFPSIWEEPLARVTQEAMASGMVVVGTNTGGTKEILVDGDTGLTFKVNDPECLAQKILQLKRDPALFDRLSRQGQSKILGEFDIEQTVDGMESHLRAVASLAETRPEAVSSQFA